MRQYIVKMKWRIDIDSLSRVSHMNEFINDDLQIIPPSLFSKYSSLNSSLNSFMYLKKYSIWALCVLVFLFSFQLCAVEITVNNADKAIDKYENFLRKWGLSESWISAKLNKVLLNLKKKIKKNSKDEVSILLAQSISKKLGKVDDMTSVNYPSTIKDITTSSNIPNFPNDKNTCSSKNIVLNNGQEWESCNIWATSASTGIVVQNWWWNVFTGSRYSYGSTDGKSIIIEPTSLEWLCSSGFHVASEIDWFSAYSTITHLKIHSKNWHTRSYVDRETLVAEQNLFINTLLLPDGRYFSSRYDDNWNTYDKFQTVNVYPYPPSYYWDIFRLVFTDNYKNWNTDKTPPNSWYIRCMKNNRRYFRFTSSKKELLEGESLDLTIQAVDQKGQIDTDYEGTVLLSFLTSSDQSLSIPQEVTINYWERRDFSEIEKRQYEYWVIPMFDYWYQIKFDKSEAGKKFIKNFLTYQQYKWTTDIGIESFDPSDLTTLRPSSFVTLKTRTQKIWWFTVNVYNILSGDTLQVNKPQKLEIDINAVPTNNKFENYRWTILFSTNDNDVILPTKYTFTWKEKGHVVLDGIKFKSAKEHTFTITDLETGIAQKVTVPQLWFEM